MHPGIQGHGQQRGSGIKGREWSQDQTVALRRWWRGMTMLRELSAMEPWDREHGFGGSDPGTATNWFDGVACLDAMMDRFGVDRSRLAGRRVLGAMRRVCAMCGNQRRCRRWLNAAHPVGEACPFCPMADVLDHLAERDRPSAA